MIEREDEKSSTQKDSNRNRSIPRRVVSATVLHLLSGRSKKYRRDPTEREKEKEKETERD